MSMSLFSPLAIAIIAMSASSASYIPDHLSLFHSDIAMSFLMQGIMCASFCAFAIHFILHSLADSLTLLMKHILLFIFCLVHTVAHGHVKYTNLEF